jgi:hypothetical protein
MRWLLVAIGPADLAIPERLALQRLVVGDLALVYQEAIPSGDLADVLAFAATVEELFARNDLLPMRYGCLMSENEARDLLKEGAKRFGKRLERVRGCVEMGIRVLPESIAKSSTQEECPLNGRDYLERRRQEFAAREAELKKTQQWSEALRAALGGCVKEILVEMPTQRTQTLSVAVLVPRAQQEVFRVRCADFEQSGNEPMLVTGPWPPYSFTMEEG